MKHSFAVLVFVIGSCFGCQIHHGSQNLQSATGAVLQEHHFAPASFMDTAAGLYAVAARPRSDSSVQIACVRLKDNGQSCVEITSYQYVGSDWAVVGPLLAPDGHTEVEEIQRAIELRLRKP
jgi:hypothetical protein